MKSIRGHLGIVLCSVIGGLFLLTGVAVFFAMRHWLVSQFDQTLAAKAGAIITASEIDDGEFEVDLTIQDFAGFGTGGSDFFEIRRLSGAGFLKSPSLDGHSAGLWSPGDRLPPSDLIGRVERGRLSDGRSARFYSRRFVPKDDDAMTHRDLYLVVASPDGGVRKQLAGLGIVLGVAGGAALLLMVPLIRTGLSRGLRPLDRLAAEVVAIRPGVRGTGPPLGACPEELAPMVGRLNEWIATVDESFERQKRFSAHAAHELRTPLAELRLLAEVGAAWPEDATPERCSQMLEVIRELEGLLETLFLLARAESGGHPMETAPIDAGHAIASAMARHRQEAEARGIRVIEETVPAPIVADPVLWSAVVHNLIGNAVHHAPAGSIVRVVTLPGRLEVSNPAPGLTDEDTGRMFEAFWTADPARSGRRHCGLGLSIVKACAGLLGAACHSRLEDGVLTMGVRWEVPAASGSEGAC